MAKQLTHVEIISLLSEPKALPSDYQSRLQLRVKTGHKERELDLLVYALYGLTPDEIQIVEGAAK
jgi:DNA-binding CsgD family transcriptional regulator